MSEPTIKAIPTKYDGVEFRSRLEARWAVFYNVLGIKWFYEYEGYQLQSGWYVPDFWLQEINGGCFVEIKPKEPSDEEEASCRDLAAFLEKDVFLFWGPPSTGDDAEPGCAAMWMAGGVGDRDYWWCQCPQCGKFGIQFSGRAERICGNRCHGRGPQPTHKHYDWENPVILEAIDVARKHKFW